MKFRETASHHHRKSFYHRWTRSAVAEVLAETGSTVPLKRIGVNERFGQVGTPDFLQKEYGLDAASIKQQIVKGKVRDRKRKHQRINSWCFLHSFQILKEKRQTARQSCCLTLLWTKTKTSAVSFLLRLMESRKAYFRWEYLRFWWLAVTCQALFCAANAWWWQWNLGFYFLQISGHLRKTANRLTQQYVVV